MSAQRPTEGPPDPDFCLLFESAPGLFLVLAPDLRIVAVSDAYVAATKTRRSDILGRGIFDVFPDNPDDPAASGVRNLRASLDHVRKAREPNTMAVQKYDIRRPDSEGGGFEERYWSPVNFPVCGPDGRLAYIIHRVEDVTEFVRLKEQGHEHKRRSEELQSRTERMEAEVYIRAQEVSEANRKLSKAHTELERLYEKTKELDELKTQFFANVSHELRTPLALILGPVETLLASTAAPQEAREQLAVIQGNARLLLKHVNDLLDVARLDAGKLAVSYVDGDLAGTVRFAAGHFSSLAREKHIAFSIDAPEVLASQFDPEKIQRVIVNLLSNAFKFTPSSGTIRCSLRRSEQVAVIEVADSGPGIPPKHREAVFDRFHQIEPGASRRRGGTGLGLTIARDFVGMHGGTVSIGDAPEGGALFTVVLPLRAPDGAVVSRESADAAEMADAARHAMSEFRASPAADATEPTPVGATGRPLVLVVEDNAEMNRFVRDSLALEYRTAGAVDGREGLRLALELRPDLIVSDVMMPAMSGDQLVLELRSRSDVANVPILLLTAKADDDLRVAMLRTGANDYLMKPFSVEELRARARNLISITAAQLQAERATQAKNVFLSRMSHELRTPLNAILGFAQLLEMDARLAAEHVEGTRQILKGGHHLLNLINEVLDICRIESGRLSLSPEPVDVGEAIHSAVNLVRPLASQGGITVEVTALPARAAVRADRQRLNQVLLNLLSNGIKYNRRAGHVRVSAESVVSGRLRISVRDSGAGIPSAKLQLLFQPFERLGAEQAGVEGSGLGLALSKALAEAMGGTLGVESIVDQGSTFWLELAAAGELTAATHATAVQDSIPASSTHSGTVLYVEDNLSNVRLMESLIRHRPGVVLLHAPTGESGLTLARERRPDVIFLDLHLPDFSGEEVLRQLWQDPQCRSIPVIVMTADATPGVTRRLHAAGAMAFLTKPIDVRGVLDLLDRVLSNDVSRPIAPSPEP